MRRSEWLSATVGIVTGLLLAREARADRIVDAEQLFRQAKALVAAGKDVEACPLFAESHRLDPGVGTLLNLALCHEKIGRVASAWGEFRAVEQQARATNPERAELARKHAAALEPRISRLRVTVADPPEGIVLAVDGEEKPKVLWSSIAVDPGSHVLTASAPGRRPRELRVKVDDEAITVDVRVPALEIANPKAEPMDSEREESRRTRRTAGYLVAGTGLAALAVGAGFGVAAIVTDQEAQDECPGSCFRGSRPAADADRLTDRALDFATVSNVVLGAGAAAVLVGGFLILTARPPAVPVTASARGLEVRF